MNEAKTALLDKLLACKQACEHCFDACLQEDDVKMMAECIRTDRECADICGIVINYAHRESPIFEDLVAACKKACDLCAQECEKHADHHDHCKQCAIACRECEAACQAYLSA